MHHESSNFDLWFRAKVQESLDDPRPSLPHDEAMARVEKLLNEKRADRTERVLHSRQRYP